MSSLCAIRNCQNGTCEDFPNDMATVEPPVNLGDDGVRSVCNCVDGYRGDDCETGKYGQGRHRLVRTSNKIRLIFDLPLVRTDHTTSHDVFSPQKSMNVWSLLHVQIVDLMVTVKIL